MSVTDKAAKELKDNDCWETSAVYDPVYFCEIMQEKYGLLVVYVREECYMMVDHKPFKCYTGKIKFTLIR